MRKKSAQNKVMIADDNAFIRFLVNKLLGEHAQIIEAEHGSEVISIYEETRPDILFLDIHLPGRNGLKILEEIVQKHPSAFIVMVSADSLRDNVITSAKAGAKAFITKPFKRNTLMKYFQMCPTVHYINNQVLEEA